MKSNNIVRVQVILILILPSAKLYRSYAFTDLKACPVVNPTGHFLSFWHTMIIYHTYDNTREEVDIMVSTCSPGSICFQTEAFDHIEYGQIRYCKLENAKNSSLHKTRPCIIVQTDCDVGNKIAVIPLTSEPKAIGDPDGTMLTLRLQYEYREDKISYVYPEGLIFLDRAKIDCYIAQCPEDLLQILKQSIISRF